MRMRGAVAVAALLVAVAAAQSRDEHDLPLREMQKEAAPAKGAPVAALKDEHDIPPREVLEKAAPATLLKDEHDIPPRAVLAQAAPATVMKDEHDIPPRAVPAQATPATVLKDEHDIPPREALAKAAPVGPGDATEAGINAAGQHGTLQKNPQSPRSSAKVSGPNIALALKPNSFLSEVPAANADVDVDVRNSGPVESALKNEERALQARLQKIVAHKERIQHKKSMLAHVRELRAAVEKREVEVGVLSMQDHELRVKRDRALQTEERLKRDLASLEHDADRAALEIEHIEKDTMPEITAQIDLLQGHLLAAGGREQGLFHEEKKLLAKLRAVAAKFRAEGMHSWLLHNTHDLSPSLRESVLLAVAAVEPIAETISDGVENVMEFDAEAISEFTEHTGVRDPVIVGIFFDLLVLAPTVAMMWLCFKIRHLASHIPLNMYIFLLAVYFTVLSGVCAVSSLIHENRDVILAFHDAHPRTAMFFILCNLLLFVALFVFQAVFTVGRHQAELIVQLIALFAIGVHFYLYGLGRGLVRSKSEIGFEAYTFYFLTFCFIMATRSQFFKAPPAWLLRLGRGNGSKPWKAAASNDMEESKPKPLTSFRCEPAPDAAAGADSQSKPPV